MMRAAFCPAPGVIEVRETARPDPVPDTVVVRVRQCGICGSDLHWFHGGLPPPAVCPGHEIVGEVAALGAQVPGMREGDRVVVEPLVVCRECRACRSGNPQLCPQLQIVGVMCAGGLADYVAVPGYTVYPVPAALDDAVAALTEPTAVCVHGARLGGVRLGDRVLVLGAGSVGLLSVLAARAAGAAEVAVTARHPHQAEMARRLGATRVFATTPEGEQERVAFAGDHPFDVVMETVGGTADTINDALFAARPGGTVVVLGVFSSLPTIAALVLVTKEVRVVGSLVYDRVGPHSDFDVALQLLVAQCEAVRPLLTHRFSLDEAQLAFETAADKTRGAIKVGIVP